MNMKWSWLENIIQQLRTPKQIIFTGDVLVMYPRGKRQFQSREANPNMKTSSFHGDAKPLVEMI